MLRGRSALVGITITSGLGWILFGYDLGMLGGVLDDPDFERQFNLSTTWQGLMSAIFELFAMVGALVMVAVGHRLGRRDNICIGTGLIAIGSAVQASSFSTAQLLVGRIVGGIGLGIFTAQCPTWQAETSSRQIRGRVIGSALSFLCIGLIIAYFLDYGMAGYQGSISWRFPFAFQSVLAMSNIVCARFMPESPRYLLLKGRETDARRVLAALKDLPDDDDAVSGELHEIQVAIDLEAASKRGFRDLFRKDDHVRSRRRMLTACAIQMCQPFSGSTVISFYVVNIFTSTGLDANMASLMSGVLQIWFFIASIGTWYLIERVGRRRMFMVSASLMTVDMVVLAVMLKINNHASGIVAILCVFLYESFYTWGWMAAVWMYNTEIQTLSYRTFGSGLGAASQWLFNFTMVLWTPVAFTNIGWKTYIAFAVFNAAFIPFIYFAVPETAGLPLESIDLCFAPGKDPIKESDRLRRLMKEGRMDELRLGGDHKVAGDVREELADNAVKMDSGV